MQFLSIKKGLRTVTHSFPQIHMMILLAENVHTKGRVLTNTNNIFLPEKIQHSPGWCSSVD